MIYAINYNKGETFAISRKYNTKTAYERGRVDCVIEYSEADIVDYVGIHGEVFDIQRGAGLWLWKPYIILKTLLQMEDEDYLIYADGGSFYVDDVHALIAVMERDQTWLMPFEMPLLNRQFCKHEAYSIMGCDIDDSNQCCATEIVFKKTQECLTFVREWLHACEDIRVLSPDRYLLEIDEFPDLIAHREDQSIFSLLVRKWNLTVYKEPTEAGEMPWTYAYSCGKYVRHYYPTCSYGIVLMNARKNEPLEYERRIRAEVKKSKEAWVNPEKKLFFIWKIKHVGKKLLQFVGLYSLLKKP